MSVSISRAFALAGLVLATGAVTAHAQEQQRVAPLAPTANTSVAERQAQRAETPWYESFTYSHGPSETMTGLGPSERTAQPAFSLSQRWGVTVDLGSAQASRQQASPIAPANERAVGAFFRFTPRVRVGGEVSVSDPEPAPVAPTAPVNDRPNAGVRLESAFRF